MSHAALSHAVNGFFDSFKSRASSPAVAAQPASRASQVRIESRYNEGDDESLLESATSLPRPTLKALEKSIRADGFKGAQVSGWGQGERGGFTVHYGGEQYEFEIAENTAPRPVGEIGRLVKASGRYGQNGRGVYHESMARNSSMNERQQQFIDETHRHFDPVAHDRQLFFRTGWADGLHVTYVNLPKGVGSAGGGAEAQNNRMDFDVTWFADRVKIEQSSTFDRSRKLRAKTGTPAAVARYLADYLTRFAAEVPPRFTHTTLSRNGRRTGILSEGTRVNVYYDDKTPGEPWTVVPHGMDWDAMERGGMRTMLGMSETGSGISQFTEGQEGRHLGRSVPWDAVPENIRRHIERRLVSEGSMVANARRAKGVTVDDLPVSPGNRVLACPSCHVEYSAARGDYFDLPPGEVLACSSCEKPFVLRTRI